MPELPEVETIRRDLQPSLIGRRILAVWHSGKPLRQNRPLAVAELREICAARTIIGLSRRAKYLLLDTDAHASVVVHLGMSGRLTLAASTTARAPHTHVAWRLDDGNELRYTDPRRFGFVCAIAQGATLPELSNLGVEPLDGALDAEWLHRQCKAARRSIKALLLDQTVVAGLGNIYVCEALFEAGIHPGARACRLSLARCGALKNAIVQVLSRGLENRGTTLRDYVDGGGNAGKNQNALRVYDRTGEACQRGDGGKIVRRSLLGRGTFYCPRCQRAA